MTEIFESLKEINFWGKKRPQLGFIRDFYLQKVEAYLGNNLTKVLIGQRRVGKSYLMRQLIARLISQGVNPRNTFYLNKEYIEFENIITERDLSALIALYKKRMKVKGKVYLFLDEIQEIENWEKLANSLSQHPARQYEVFITGSNSRMLSSELSTLLSGRYIPFEVFPYSYREYCTLLSVDINKASFLAYLEMGGMPELYHLPGHETRFNYINSLKDAILMNDIVRKFNIKDVNLLDLLFLYLCQNVGNIFSVNNIVNYLNSHRVKTNHETVSSYLSYLCRAMLVREVSRYDIRGKSVLSSSRKYYLNDVSFKKYLTSGFEPGLGGVLENVLFNHLKASGAAVYVGALYNLEVDFIVERGGEKEYYQVCYSMADSSTAEREYASLLKIKDNYKKTVVSLDDASFGSREGIDHLLLWELCGDTYLP